MPGDRDVTYSYDARGQMRTLTDWDNQTTQFSYDAVGRHTLTQRANGLRSLYRYDAGGRLRLLRHVAASRVLDADYYPGENTASTPACRRTVRDGGLARGNQILCGGATSTPQRGTSAPRPLICE